MFGRRKDGVENEEKCVKCCAYIMMRERCRTRKSGMAEVIWMHGDERIWYGGGRDNEKMKTILK